jgi:hypothetical protein
MWNLGLDPRSAAQQGLISAQLSLEVTCPNDQNGLTLSVLHSSAQITGVVEDGSGNPITNLGVYASATINGTQYNTSGQTDQNGDYSAPVAAGVWQVSLNCNDLNSRGFPTCPNSQTVTIPSQNETADFTVQAHATCVGDCNGDGSVSIDDIIEMVDIALGDLDVSRCPAGDANDDNQITIDEILKAVSVALNGCAVSPAEQGCLNSGGTVGSAMCCTGTGDFPNTCGIGACGCGPDASHEVRICNCSAGCFDGSACVPT